MEMQAQTTSSTPRREPWNKGKLIGQKPSLRPKHVWSIRTRLQKCGHRCCPNAALVCLLIRCGIEFGSNAVATFETHRALQGAGLWRYPRVSNYGRSCSRSSRPLARNRANFCSVAVVITTAA
jgi:hypothetical protein